MQRTAANILVVDDSRDIRNSLAAYLGRQGFQVTCAESAEEARYLVERRIPDLMVLDIMMPGEDGVSLCGNLRERHAIPIIMLSALKGDATKVKSLDIGADDYLVKPFNPRELVARMRAVLRRYPAAARTDRPSREIAPGMTHDPGLKMVRLRDGREIVLTTGENDMLAALSDDPGRIVTRDYVNRNMTNNGRPHTNRSIDNIISRLRKKLGDDARNPRIIMTEWGGGYRIPPLADRETR